jgi:hypothetical protein
MVYLSNAAGTAAKMDCAHTSNHTFYEEASDQLGHELEQDFRQHQRIVALFR